MKKTKQQEIEILRLKLRLSNEDKMRFLNRANSAEAYRAVCLDIYAHLVKEPIGAINKTYVLEQFRRVMK